MLFLQCMLGDVLLCLEILICENSSVLSINKNINIDGVRKTNSIDGILTGR